LFEKYRKSGDFAVKMRMWTYQNKG